MLNRFHLHIYLSVTLFIMLSLVTVSHAAIMMSGKLSYNYDTSPGSTETGTIDLRNSGKEAAEVKLYQEDAPINQEGKVEFVATGEKTHARSNANWLRLSTDRIILQPNQKQTVSYTITVPNDKKLKGSYWSVIHLEPVSKNSPESDLKQATNDDKKTGKKDITFRIQQKMRYAVQIRTHIGDDSAANLVFSDPKINKDDKGERHFYIDIKNTDIRYSRPELHVDVFDKKGTFVKKLEGKTRGLYPQARKTFDVDMSSLAPGQYKGLIAAEDDVTGQIFGSDINLTVNP